jgi:hypothetical protein
VSVSYMPVDDSTPRWGNGDYSPQPHRSLTPELDDAELGFALRWCWVFPLCTCRNKKVSPPPSTIWSAEVSLRWFVHSFVFASQQSSSFSSTWAAIGFLSYPGSKRVEPKPPYVCPRCSNHTYSNNIIIRWNVQWQQSNISYIMTCRSQKITK